MFFWKDIRRFFFCKYSFFIFLHFRRRFFLIFFSRLSQVRLDFYLLICFCISSNRRFYEWFLFCFIIFLSSNLSFFFFFFFRRFKLMKSERKSLEIWLVRKDCSSRKIDIKNIKDGLLFSKMRVTVYEREHFFFLNRIMAKAFNDAKNKGKRNGKHSRSGSRMYTNKQMEKHSHSVLIKKQLDDQTIFYFRKFIQVFRRKNKNFLFFLPSNCRSWASMIKRYFNIGNISRNFPRKIDFDDFWKII